MRQGSSCIQFMLMIHWWSGDYWHSGPVGLLVVRGPWAKPNNIWDKGTWQGVGFQPGTTGGEPWKAEGGTVWPKRRGQPWKPPTASSMRWAWNTLLRRRGRRKLADVKFSKGFQICGQVARKYLAYEPDATNMRRLPLSGSEWYFSNPPRQGKAEALAEGEAVAIYRRLVELGLLEQVAPGVIYGAFMVIYWDSLGFPGDFIVVFMLNYGDLLVFDGDFMVI